MSLARCIRCEAFFQLDGDDEARCCTYHPGVYRLWWSCCREPLQSATGCRRGTHVADPHATALLDSMCEIASSANRATGEETGGEQQRVLITGPDGVTYDREAIEPQLGERGWSAADLVPHTSLRAEMVAALQEHVGEDDEG